MIITFNETLNLLPDNLRTNPKVVSILSEVYSNITLEEKELESYLFLYLFKYTRTNFIPSTSKHFYRFYCEQLDIITSLGDFYLYEISNNLSSKLLLKNIFKNGTEKILKNSYMYNFLRI